MNVRSWTSWRSIADRLEGWSRGTQWPRHIDPAPRWLWLVVALLPAGFLLFVAPLPPDGGSMDWRLYGQHEQLWRTTGTPYEVPVAAFSPFDALPYTYPPTSWPLLVLAAAFPPALAWVAVSPLLLTPPRLRLVPLGAFLTTIGLGSALWLGNVSLLAAGLLTLAFRHGAVGGAAFACTVALRPYPLLLLPFFLSDRRWLITFAGVFAALLVSGTVLLGPQGWIDFLLINLRQQNLGRTWNPFGDLGLLRIAPALALAAVGLRLRSPTLTIVGATFIAGHVTDHYLLVIAAALPFERRWHIRHIARRLDRRRSSETARRQAASR